jgi:hypothetical protein
MSQVFRHRFQDVSPARPGSPACGLCTLGWWSAGKKILPSREAEPTVLFLGGLRRSLARSRFLSRPEACGALAPETDFGLASRAPTSREEPANAARDHGRHLHAPLGLSHGWVQPRIEVETLLAEKPVFPDSTADIEDHIPAPAGHGARNRHERVGAQPLVPEVLLGCAERTQGPKRRAAIGRARV